MAPFAPSADEDWRLTAEKLFHSSSMLTFQAASLLLLWLSLPIILSAAPKPCLSLSSLSPELCLLFYCSTCFLVEFQPPGSSCLIISEPPPLSSSPFYPLSFPRTLLPAYSRCGLFWLFRWDKQEVGEGIPMSSICVFYSELFSFFTYLSYIFDMVLRFFFCLIAWLCKSTFRESPALQQDVDLSWSHL